MTDKERITLLEKELRELKKLFVITPTMIRITKSIQVDGRVNGDRIYTQRSNSYVELTT